MHRPMVDRDWLVELKEGLILLSGAKDGDLGKALLKGNPSLIDSVSGFYQREFADHYFLELVRTERPQEEEYLHLAVAHSYQTGIPVVATNEVVFLHKEDFEPHEIRVAIHDGYTLDDNRRPKRYSEQQYFKN